MTTERFAFAFDPRFALLLAAMIGARESTSEVVIDDDRFAARFGRLRMSTRLTNVRDVQVTRDYRWYRALGARLSLADRGATFGSNTRAGVCVAFHEPVPVLLGGWVRHPSLTVTVEDPDALAAALRRRLTS